MAVLSNAYMEGPESGHGALAAQGDGVFEQAAATMSTQAGQLTYLDASPATNTAASRVLQPVDIGDSTATASGASSERAVADAGTAGTTAAEAAPSGSGWVNSYRAIETRLAQDDATKNGVPLSYEHMSADELGQMALNADKIDAAGGTQEQVAAAFKLEPGASADQVSAAWNFSNRYGNFLDSNPAAASDFTGQSDTSHPANSDAAAPNPESPIISTLGTNLSKISAETGLPIPPAGSDAYGVWNTGNAIVPDHTYTDSTIQNLKVSDPALASYLQAAHSAISPEGYAQVEQSIAQEVGSGPQSKYATVDQAIYSALCNTNLSQSDLLNGSYAMASTPGINGDYRLWRNPVSIYVAPE